MTSSQLLLPVLEAEPDVRVKGQILSEPTASLQRGRWRRWGGVDPVRRGQKTTGGEGLDHAVLHGRPTVLLFSASSSLFSTRLWAPVLAGPPGPPGELGSHQQEQPDPTAPSQSSQVTSGWSQGGTPECGGGAHGMDLKPLPLFNCQLHQWRKRRSFIRSKKNQPRPSHRVSG